MPNSFSRTCRKGRNRRQMLTEGHDKVLDFAAAMAEKRLKELQEVKEHAKRHSFPFLETITSLKGGIYLEDIKLLLATIGTNPPLEYEDWLETVKHLLQHDLDKWPTLEDDLFFFLMEAENDEGALPSSPLTTSEISEEG